MNYYIGLDLGTSGIKSVVFDKKGNIVTSYLEEYDIISPKNGYAEEDPNVWLEKTISVLHKIGTLDIKDDIRGIGISGQMHGLVLLDKDDNVLRNSIIWCDNRTDNEKEYLESKLGNEYLKEITGNVAMAPFTLCKLLWVKNNEPEIFSKIAKVMLPKDYINYMLTKSFTAEYSDASGMQMLDVRKKEFSKELLDKLEIDINILPKLIKSYEISGYLTKEMEEKTGLSNVFVVGGAGDQACGALGNGIVKSSDASIVLGSSGVVYSPIDDLFISANGEIQTFITTAEDRYHVMGVTNGCGTSLKWLRDNITNISYDAMMLLASESEVGANGIIYLPYLMGERTPILDSKATGLFIGIRNNTEKKDIIRAVIEGVGYSIKDCFNLIPGKKEKVLISGGGAKSKLYREIIASMIDTELVQIKQDEGPALGAAILAMVANNEYKTLDDAVAEIIKIDNITKPNKVWVKYYNDRYKIYKELYNANKNIYKMMERKEYELF